MKHNIDFIYRHSLAEMTSGHFRENAHSAGNFMIRGDPMENYSHKNDRWSFPRLTMSDDIADIVEILF
jgi:hypothetical protein